MIREDLDWPNMENPRKIEALIRVAADYSRHYLETGPLRQAVWKKYGFKTTVIKCADSRPNLRKYAELHEGETYPIRAIGAKFDAGVPHFNESLSIRIEESYGTYTEGHLIVVSTHFSKSTKHLCCAGFNHDTIAAVKAMLNLRDRLKKIYRKWKHVVVIPIIMETDTEEIVIVGDNDQRVKTSEFGNAGEMIARINCMFPNIPRKFKDYIIERLILGNLSHLKQGSKKEKLLISLDHHEFMLGHGAGFWWTPEHRCLIMNQFDLRPKPFFTGCDVIEEVIRAGKNRNGWIFNPSSTFLHPKDKDRAIEQTLFFLKKGLKRLREHRKNLYEMMDFMPIVVDRKTMRIEVIETKMKK